MKRLFDPYGSLGQVVNRVSDIAILYFVEMIVVGWALIAGNFTALVVAVASVGATSLWDAVLYSKLKIPLHGPLSGWQPSWLRAFLGLLGAAQCQLIWWLTSERSSLHVEMVARFGRNFPLIVALAFSVYTAYLAAAYILRWRKASKTVFERPPTDPVLEQMARELDNWLTHPKKAI